ncbi:MAG: MBOAT family protein [Lentisphaerae bacterium]|nr:MBOAT family protein [Lentisphaerota bacterium]
MLFTSFIFLQIFLPAVILVNSCLRKIKWKNSFLLGSSLFFYAWGEPHNVFLLLFSLLVNYFIAVKKLRWELPDSVRKKFFILGVIFNLSILFVFKYTSSVLCFFDGIFDFNFRLANIALPLGISFFTFQIISYLADTYKKQDVPQKNFLDLSLYVMLFPQLIAGPIVKYHDIEKQLTDRKTSLEDFVCGIRRFVYGLAKKVLIANQMACLADDIFLVPGTALDCKIAWLGIICYTLQIYFDFSGYSDMAIGLGRMLGFRFKENFNLPYIARSVQDFWHRWHISLSSWFKEYLYIPLGGSKVSGSRTYLNIMIVFICTGIWYGAGLNFAVWGVYYGVLLILERRWLKKWLEKCNIAAHIYTLTAVMIGWVFFRSENLSDAYTYCCKLFSFTNNPGLPLQDFLNASSGVLIIIAVLFAGPIQRLKCFRDEIGRQKNRWYDYIVQPLLLAAVLILLAGNTYNPFIYFRF